jgi:hypothetical protein
LGFLGCSSFFLRIFDVEAIFFPLSNFLNAKMHAQNALKAPTDRPQHFAQIFIAAPMKSRFHSTKLKKAQPLDWPQEDGLTINIKVFILKIGTKHGRKQPNTYQAEERRQCGFKISK